MTRTCLDCNRELPANSRPGRKFCSSACRYRHWNAANPPAWIEEVRVPLHWHGGHHVTLLAGDYHAGYWRGPEGCPPECPGLKPPYTWSQAIPEGRRGLPPMRAMERTMAKTAGRRR